MEGAASNRTTRSLLSANEMQMVIRAHHPVLNKFNGAVATTVVHDANGIGDTAQSEVYAVKQFPDVAALVQNRQQNTHGIPR
jgi:hypothetical protein